MYQEAIVIRRKNIQDRSHEPDFKVRPHPEGADCSQAEELLIAYMRSHTKSSFVWWVVVFTALSASFTLWCD